MTDQLYISFKKTNLFNSVGLLASVYIILALIALYNYLPFQSLNFILGLMALPFALQIQQQGKKNYRFGWMVIGCIVLCFIMPVSTILYFTFCFALFFLIEQFYGRINLLAVFTIILMAPVFQYFVNAFSFPIRLELTKLAGTIFNVFDKEVLVRGNVIIHHGNEFSVDPGCMGLKMMETSLLLGVMLLGFYQKRFQRKLTTWKLLLYFGSIAGLNIIANLIRIVLLVQFSVLPETFSHELAGGICLVVYVFLPSAWLAFLFIKRSPVQNNTVLQICGISRKSIILHLFVLSSTFFLSLRVSNADTYKSVNIDLLNQQGDYLVSQYSPGILKLQNEQALIYIKYIRGFYDTDHNPMICWKGSGYVFEQIQKEKIGTRELYTGMLINGDEKLYSAWWYDNGHTSGISQFKWRWDMIKGSEDYAVVNVTCSGREELEKRLKIIFQQKTLDKFFN